MDDTGIVYFAKGEGYRKEAVKSARQTNQVMPNTPIVLVTDKLVNSGYFKKEITDDERFSKEDKAKALLNSPFKKTIFLDSDIYVNEDISELFELLEEFDMALAADPKDHHLFNGTETNIPEPYPELNTGVVVYEKNNVVWEMLQDWKEKCEPWHTADQPSFRDALYNSEVRYTTLPRRYNYMYRAPAHLKGKVKVFHGTLSDHRGSKPLHKLDIEKAQYINDQQSPRVSFKLGDGLVVKPPQSLLQIFIDQLMYTNLRSTAKRSTEFIYNRSIAKLVQRLRKVLFRLRTSSLIQLQSKQTKVKFSASDASPVNWDYRDDFHSEQEIIADLLEELNEQDVFYDIGANVGIYSCFVGKKSKQGQVIAFEPHPRNYQSLKENCTINDINSKIYQIALGARKDEMYLEPMGNTGHVIKNEYQPGWEKVKMITGDEFIGQHSLPHPDICKIDVEGAELEVLSGLKNTLSQGKCRTIYCEIHPEKIKNGDESINDLIDLLSNMNYNIEYLQNRSGNIFVKAIS